ncbi:citramalate synthase [Candidatus Woesearchaeota archaeon]|nr:citramalate synthase [Candidatus Woesearchaeota archaeon]
MALKIYDTTLRDGSQSTDVNFGLRDKLEIVRALDDFGADYIELGWPGSNPKDMECFAEAAKVKLKYSKIVAFGATRRKGIKAKQDYNLQAILKSKARVACIFGKTWLEHVKKQLKADEKENLAAIKDSVEFLKKNKLEVHYDLEHFFDGFKDDKKYALECLKVAADAGADVLVLCDTNGGCLPDDAERIIREVNVFLKREKIKAELGVHMHNDSGCGVANSLKAVELGVTHLHGTINGLGERAGNADLCQIIPGLMLKKKARLPRIRLKRLVEISRLVYTLTNLKPDNRQPYVGGHAFSHKGGVHVDALMKGATYEHVDPASVGNMREVVLSDLSGKANIVEVAKEFGVKVEKDDPRVKEMLKEVEFMEKKGYDIGGLKAERFLLHEKYFGKNPELFRVKKWSVKSEHDDTTGKETSSCVLLVDAKGKVEEFSESVKGGPVDALYKALRTAIAKSYKNLQDIKLLNYKVRIFEEKGVESSVRVYIEFKNGKEEWGTVGVSTNIIEASFKAIVKGFKYYLLKHN